MVISFLVFWLFVPAFPEILRRLLIFTDLVVTFTISGLDGAQVQICLECA